ncbi:MAG: carboxypeptidase-like regulatory domain-containing protein, partial [Ferruginibacter sp.]
MRFIPLLFFLLLSGCCLELSGQHIFKGSVLESGGEKYLPGVTVTAGNKVVAVTDTNGVFEFNSSKETTNLYFSHIGYLTASGRYTAGKNPIIFLTASNSLLSGIIVKAFESNTALMNMPVTVSVLGKADLERYGNTSILPAVNSVPGVKMDERSPGSFRLSIRGNLLRS